MNRRSFFKGLLAAGCLAAARVMPVGIEEPPVTRTKPPASWSDMRVGDVILYGTPHGPRDYYCVVGVTESTITVEDLH